MIKMLAVVMTVVTMTMDIVMMIMVVDDGMMKPKVR